MLKIYSWNINGLRAVLKKGALQDFLEKEQPDILCLQEIKAKPEQIDYAFPGYKVFWNSARRPGYSGTATLIKKELASQITTDDDADSGIIIWPSEVNSYIDGFLKLDDEVDAESRKTEEKAENTFRELAEREGRILVLDCGAFYLVNVYTPNAKPDLSRLDLREKEWDPEYLKLLKKLEETKPVITCGDFNVAHEEIDIARPKTNHHSAGFTDEERRGMTNYLSAGLVDTFRSIHPDSVRYTWWSHWGQARANNVGWRIDYFLISEKLKKSLKSAEIFEKYTGSDHCPVAIELEI